VAPRVRADANATSSTSIAIPSITLGKSEAAKPEAVNLSLVKPGMTKPEVVAAVGKPNIETKTGWFYVDRGFVRFADEKVSAVEVR
jgi:outer membrane protein assembly factor BamE (lipoprotein component of BamABCDE complex)